MIKRTLFFGNPVYLALKNGQLKADFIEEGKTGVSVPIEDIGMVVLENPQITITNGLIAALMARKVAVLNCNRQHMPEGLMLPLAGHTEQSERFQLQAQVSKPLKKNLWQQIIQAKIHNQGLVLKSTGREVDNFVRWEGLVNSGDTHNLEGRAASYYWQHLWPEANFNRHRDGSFPNNALNYGYAILRAITARALVSSGLHPTLGLFHRNKYNAFCLADDLMEAYRPIVDVLVLDLVEEGWHEEELSVEMKRHLLQLPSIDVLLDGQRSPLMVALSRTSNSLMECFYGTNRKLLLPKLII